VISRVTGRLLEVGEGTALLEVGSLVLELIVPAGDVAGLLAARGREVTLHTILHLEGNPALGNLTPRLIGFASPADRAFFCEFTKVKGVSARRALRAMSVPASQLAAAIEHGDERLLTTLPEIGRKTAAQIVTELRGKLTAFLTAAPAERVAEVAELPAAHRTALEILVSWGDRRPEALRWVSIVREQHPELGEPDAIVREAYRVKART
jgi:Holliday junction DNA helicase RuvA